LTPDQVQKYRGHPTVSGPRDEYTKRRGRESPGNGQPGFPVPNIPPDSHGPGIPGNTPTGPMQPGAGIEEMDI